MVNIAGRDRISKLIDIAIKTFPESLIQKDGDFLISVYPKPTELEQLLSVYLLLGNEILLKSPRLFKEAIKLALAYEDSGETKFSILKNY